MWNTKSVIGDRTGTFGGDERRDPMAQRGNQSFEKRQREANRQDRAREKDARRQERREAEDSPTGVDEGVLMAEYGRLAERHDNGDITEEQFVARKQEIFEALGLDVD